MWGMLVLHLMPVVVGLFDVNKRYLMQINSTDAYRHIRTPPHIYIYIYNGAVEKIERWWTWDFLDLETFVPPSFSDFRSPPAEFHRFPSAALAVKFPAGKASPGEFRWYEERQWWKRRLGSCDREYHRSGDCKRRCHRDRSRREPCTPSCSSPGEVRSRSIG